MWPEWYLDFSRSSGPAFLSAWSNADVAVAAFGAFAIFTVLATILASDWPFDVAFLSLVAGGILVSWPAMIVLTMAAVVLTLVTGGLHALLFPGRNARISAEAKARVMPELEEFARDAGMSEAEVKRVLADDDSGEAAAMIDQPLAFLQTLLRFWNIAATAIDNSAMTLALLITAAILAAVGGMTGVRMRLYGAIVGGMIMNVVVKAMDGGFAAALAAMAVTTALAFAVGSTPFLLQVLKRARRPRG